MKTYKGMKSDMTCYGGFQYKEGNEYETAGEIKTCHWGFHGCEMPLKVLKYYPPFQGQRYFEVEQSGILDTDSDKIASSKIKINSEIGLSGLREAQMEWTQKHPESSETSNIIKDCSNMTVAGGYKQIIATPDYGIAAVGDNGIVATGYEGISSAGNGGTAITEEFGVAAAGLFGFAYGGMNGVAAVRNSGTAVVDNNGIAAAGESGRAISGNQGISVSHHDAMTGENGIACVRGVEEDDLAVRGGLGALLIIGIEDSYSKRDLKEWKTFVVDGKEVKADTWYTLKNGELVEVCCNIKE